jgi:uncharacterized protein (TIGR02001 family)
MIRPISVRLEVPIGAWLADLGRRRGCGAVNGLARKLLNSRAAVLRTPQQFSESSPMNHSLVTLACAATLLSAVPAQAQSAAAPADSPATFNVALTTDYRYRGISQTRLKPAFQFGADKSFTSGFYLGAWASTIKWVKDAEGDAGLEIDLYGGFKGELAKDVAFDVGVLQYLYPSAKTTKWNAAYKDPNTTEIYGAVTTGPVTAKLSYALSNLFGNYDFAKNKDSKGSLYFDLSASFDLGGGLMLAPHIGYQKVVDIANASYTDYSLSISKDFNGWVPSLTLVGTDADKGFYVPGVAAKSSKFLGKAGIVAAIKYNF